MRPGQNRDAIEPRICRVSLTCDRACGQQRACCTRQRDRSRQCDGLGNVGAGGHSELHGLLDVVAIPVPLVQERSKGAVAGADGRNQLDVELTLGVPDVLAVGEVSVAAATTGEQHV